MAGANSNNGTGFRRSRGVNWTEVTLHMHNKFHVYKLYYLFVILLIKGRNRASVGSLVRSRCPIIVGKWPSQSPGTLNFQEYAITLKTMFIVVYKVISKLENWNNFN